VVCIAGALLAFGVMGAMVTVFTRKVS